MLGQRAPAAARRAASSARRHRPARRRGRRRSRAPGVDLADAAAVARCSTRTGRSTGVIHGAAYTAVDLAEEEEADARRVNADACARARSRAARERAIPLVRRQHGLRLRRQRARGPTARTMRRARSRPTGARSSPASARARAAHPRGTRSCARSGSTARAASTSPARSSRSRASAPSCKVVDDQIGSPDLDARARAGAVGRARARRAGRLPRRLRGPGARWFELRARDARARGRARRRASTPVHDGRVPAARACGRAYSVLDCARLATLRGRTLAPWRDGPARRSSTDGEARE